MSVHSARLGRFGEYVVLNLPKGGAGSGDLPARALLVLFVCALGTALIASALHLPVAIATVVGAVVCLPLLVVVCRRPLQFMLRRRRVLRDMRRLEAEPADLTVAAACELVSIQKRCTVPDPTPLTAADISRAQQMVPDPLPLVWFVDEPTAARVADQIRDADDASHEGSAWKVSAGRFDAWLLMVAIVAGAISLAAFFVVGPAIGLNSFAAKLVMSAALGFVIPVLIRAGGYSGWWLSATPQHATLHRVDRRGKAKELLQLDLGRTTVVIYPGEGRTNVLGGSVGSVVWRFIPHDGSKPFEVPDIAPSLTPWAPYLCELESPYLKQPTNTSPGGPTGEVQSTGE